MSDFEKAQGIARDRWRRATPYRVGFIVGSHQYSQSHPYKKDSRGEKCFFDGVALGQQKFLEQALECSDN